MCFLKKLVMDFMILVIFIFLIYFYEFINLNFVKGLVV